MQTSQFTTNLVEKLNTDPIPENILNEKDFEQNFVVPSVFAIQKTDENVFVFGHPWGSKVRCSPDCRSAREGKGQIQPGCDKCWKDSKRWGTVNAFGIQSNFDIVAQDTRNRTLIVEIKFVSFGKGRNPNGEIQRFLGQCLIAATKFDHVIGICGYKGVLDLTNDQDTDDCIRWCRDHGIHIIFRAADTEKYGDYEIEWVQIPSFRKIVHGEEVDYTDRHGVKLYYQDQGYKITVGFIARWGRRGGGPCRIYILASDSKDWGRLQPESERILNDVRESVYGFLQKNQYGGRMKGNIYALTNA